MIQIKYKESKDRYRLIVDGHAGYAEIGQDIVCSAFSMLWQNLVFSLEEIAGNVPELYSDGNRQIMIIDNTRASNTAEVLVKSFLIGVASLENSYPNYVNYSV